MLLPIRCRGYGMVPRMAMLAPTGVFEVDMDRLILIARSPHLRPEFVNPTTGEVILITIKNFRHVFNDFTGQNHDTQQPETNDDNSVSEQRTDIEKEEIIPENDDVDTTSKNNTMINKDDTKPADVTPITIVTAQPSKSSDNELKIQPIVHDNKEKETEETTKEDGTSTNDTTDKQDSGSDKYKKFYPSKHTRK